MSETDPDIEKLTYEAAIGRLESLVRTLESGTLSLDESLSGYSLAVALSRRCALILDQAETDLKAITADGAALSVPADLMSGEPT